MPHTYKKILPSLPTILTEIVDRVSDNISVEVLPEHATVKFRHNSYEKLVEELEVDAQGASKLDRYPLIALLQPYTATQIRGNGTYKVNVDLVICTLTDAHTPASERESGNYELILKPIYAEFMQVLYDAGEYFEVSGGFIKHQRIDIYHLGRDISGNKDAYLFPDCVDAIVIKGCELTVLPTSCLFKTCVPTHDVNLFNIITQLDVTVNVGDAYIHIMFSQSFINNTGGALSNGYRIDWGDSSEVVAITPNVSTIHEYTVPGIYVGTITGDNGATAQFDVRVSDNGSGLVAMYESTYFAQSLLYNLHCNYSPIYPISISINGAFASGTIDLIEIESANGNIVFTDQTGVVPTLYQSFFSSLLNTYTVQLTSKLGNVLTFASTLNLKTI